MSVHRPYRVLVGRMCGGLWQGLIGLAGLWIHFPHPPGLLEPTDGGPPPGHPERLCPWLEMSPAEEALWRQLGEPTPGPPARDRLR
ncbi:DUF6059 family protein [Kitasatospora phosalacinea]|uniref:Uncharacterized protein n=1 Tax=Kitasatospora phosalacinea TaxID=2065 RepID=A0A9W6PJY1_9ACTN|nr:DUF6059 family protein [Kitasatospora phosalacinea]GLW56380.1 hypothetical protein Kpho01_43910 [Kitasatospora phosalacinea]